MSTECRPNVPSCLQNLSAEPKAELTNKSLIDDLSQFWLRYMNLMCNQVMIHTNVQISDLDMLICGWKMFLPMYFGMSKVNYARLALE